jgi:hypothetical protein
MAIPPLSGAERAQLLAVYQAAHGLAAPLARLEADCPYRISQRLLDYHRARVHLGRLLGVLGGLTGIANATEVPAQTRTPAA